MKIVKWQGSLYEMDITTGDAWKLTKKLQRDKRQKAAVVLPVEEVEVIENDESLVKVVTERKKAPSKNEMIAKKLFNVNDHDEEFWLEQRLKYITGSDAAAIMNVSKYKSKVVVFNEKKRGYKAPMKNKDAIKWGKIMEPVLRKQFTLEMNAKRAAKGLEPIRVQQNNFMLVHPEHEYLAANIDGEVFHPERGHGLLEIKTASEYVKDEWEGNDIPNEYMLQIHHYMLVTGLKYAYIVVLIGGNKLKIDVIDRDEEIIQLLLANEKHFYEQHLMRDIPPTMDGHNATKEMLADQHPQSSNFVERYLNENYLSVIETLSDAKERIAHWTEAKTKAENLLKNALLDSEQAFCGPYKVTWKTAKNKVRTLRITERKEPKRKKSKVDSVRQYHSQAMGV